MPKGVYNHVRTVWIPERDALVREAYLSGQSMTDIAAALKTHRNRVADSLTRTNTPSRGKGSPGEKNPAWKGGRRFDTDGYVLVYCPTHPDARENGCVLEHRLIAEAVLGRRLESSEVVHHKNKVKDDNRPDNLQVFTSNGEHLAHELAGQVPQWTNEGLERMADADRRRYEAAVERRG